MPKVSIVIPTYNHAHFLPQAVSSILSQSFPDWEALIVDDGSSDNTREVAASFTDPRIRYIYQDNRGLSAARNTGLGAARGELIALLDADDAWETEFLHRMIELLDANPKFAAAYCGFQYMDATGAPLRQSVCKVVPPDRFRDELIQKGNWLCPCSVVVRSFAYDTIGGFDESLRACEDLDMWLRISEHYEFVGALKVLVWYRRAGVNMSDDIDRMSQARVQVFGKHLGSLDTPVDTWPLSKRLAISQIYGSRAQECLALYRVAQSAEAIAWLLRHQTAAALSLDLWYSLACVHQPKGQRGDYDTWEPKRAISDVMRVLDALHQVPIPSGDLRVMRGQAFFALALLTYGQRQVGAARRALLTALWHTPGLIEQTRFWKLVIRLLPGVQALRAWRTRESRGIQETGKVQLS